MAAVLAAGLAAAPALAAPVGSEPLLPQPALSEITQPAPLEGSGACQPAVSAPLGEASALWTDAGALALSDGRRLVPEGLVLPSKLAAGGTLAQAAGRAAAAALAGCTVSAAGSPDRHGRLTGPAIARCGGAGGTASRPPAAGGVPEDLTGGIAEDLAVVLIRAGAGYARPVAGDGACRTARLAAEEAARGARRGLWAERGAIAQANDEAAMAIRAGLFTVAEGRVLAAGGARERIYLNFGASWRQDFTVMIAREDFATILGDSLQPAMLRGTLIRVRGVVREDGGPAMTVRQAGEITRLSETGPARRRRTGE